MKRRIINWLFWIPGGCPRFQNVTAVENRFQTKLAITFLLGEGGAQDVSLPFGRWKIAVDRISLLLKKKEEKQVERAWQIALSGSLNDLGKKFHICHNTVFSSLPVLSSDVVLNDLRIWNDWIIANVPSWCIFDLLMTWQLNDIWKSQWKMYCC